jgi:hypothetical protein
MSNDEVLLDLAVLYRQVEAKVRAEQRGELFTEEEQNMSKQQVIALIRKAELENFRKGASK